MANLEPVDLRTNICCALAIFAALCALPIPAFIMGAIGKYQVKQRRGFETGEGLATAAQVLAILEVIALAILYVKFRDSLGTT